MANENEVVEILSLGPFLGQISTLARYNTPKGYAKSASYVETRNTFGALKSPPGRTSEYTSPANINGIGRFYIIGSNPYIMVATTEQQVYYAQDPTTPPTALSTHITLPGGWTNAPMNFVQYGKYMFICNGKNLPQKIDSSFAVTSVGIVGPTTWTAGSLSAGGAGNPNGTYSYTFTFQTSTQESSPLPAGQVQSITVSSLQVNITNIPQPAGGSGATQINIYRVGGNLPDSYRLLGSVSVGTTSFTDNISDTVLSTKTLIVQNYIYGGGQSTTRDQPLNFTEMVLHKSCLWGILPQTDTSKISPSSWVYRSNSNEPEGWNASNALPVDPNDGDTVQTLMSYGSFLIVWKYASMYAIIGSNMGSDFQVVKLEDTGCIAPGTPDVTPDGVLFLASDGLRVWSGEGQTELYSARVNDTIQGYSLAARNAATGFFSRDLFSYFLSFPTLSITYQFNFLTRDIITLPFGFDYSIVLDQVNDSLNVMTTRGSASRQIDSWFSNSSGDVSNTTALDYLTDRIMLNPNIVFQGDYVLVYYDTTSGDFSLTLTWDGDSNHVQTSTFHPGQTTTQYPGQEVQQFTAQTYKLNWFVWHLDSTAQGSDVQVEINGIAGNRNPVLIYSVKIFGHQERSLP